MTPISATRIEERLNKILGAVLSERRTASEPSRKLAELERQHQEFALRWAEVISKSNSEMAFQFVTHASRAFELMDLAGVENWIIEAMDIYDRQGLYPGSASFRAVDHFASKLQQQEYAVVYQNVAGVLEKFIHGVCGRKLEVQPDNQAWTDTNTIYLPETINRFDRETLNRNLYKAMAAYLLAQNRYGTFRISERSGVPMICDVLQRFDDPPRALQIFEAVEQARLMYRLEQELPGLVRQLKHFNALSGESGPLNEHVSLLEGVRHQNAQVTDSLKLVEELYRKKIRFNASCYQGSFNLEAVRLASQSRVETERRSFRNELALLTEGLRKDECFEPSASEETSVEVRMTAPPDSDTPDDYDLTVTIDGKPVVPPDDMLKTAQSIVQDFGKIPDEYLVPAADRGAPGDVPQDHDASENLKLTDGHVFYYDEWDYRRQHYRKNWCVLTEKDMRPGDRELIGQILAKHSHLVRDIRRTFEVIRGEDKTLRRQTGGDDIDLDAVVESLVDVSKGNEMTDRLFIRSRKIERDLAVIFMVDVSGSTKGWINDAERESLVLLSEAVRALGDRYAIYGFSGMTRKRCEVYRIKTFDDAYDELVEARLAGIRPQDYTRMGVVIRHLSRKLMNVDAKTRVLITISDGKPDDYDGYRGEYGIEDTRQALMEAKYSGIHPFCITIDSQAHDYLPRMYGNVNYTLVSDVRKLPSQVSDIYRKITT